MSKLCNDSGINSFPSTIHSDDEDKLSIDALIGLIFLYAITTFLSLGGNILVVLVFVKGRRSRTDLRLFLINLAASDLIMAAFCMPFTFADSIMGYWVFTAPLCPIVLFFQIFSVCGSVFTNVAIGIDRFMAVSFPLHSRITYRRGKYVIALVWLCAFALSAVQFFIGRSSIYKGKVICNEEWPHPSSRPLYTVFVMILTYMFPLLILLLTYTVVGIMLWKRTAPGNKHYERDRHQLRSKIKVFISAISTHYQSIYTCKMHRPTRKVSKFTNNIALFFKDHRFTYTCTWIKKKPQLQSVIYVFSVIISFPRTLNIMVISCVSMYLSKIKNGMPRSNSFEVLRWRL